MVITENDKKMNLNISTIIKKNRKNIKDSSLKQYTTTLRKFLERIEEEPETINKNPTLILEKFGKSDYGLSDNSRKNILIALSVYADDDNKKHYQPELDKLNKLYFDKMNAGEYNDSQKIKSNITFEQLKNVLDKYKKQSNEILKSKNSITNKEHDILTDTAILLLYLDDNQAPLRNDYRNIKLIRNNDDTKALQDKTYNYYNVNKGVFYINDYKTAKRHGAIIFDVSEYIKKFLKKYVSFSPSIDWLFYNGNEEPYSSASFTNKINKIFKDNLNVPISTTMIRHIYLSHKYGDLMKIKQKLASQMNSDANKMGHSLGVQQNVYVKV